MLTLMEMTLPVQLLDTESDSPLITLSHQVSPLLRPRLPLMANFKKSDVDNEMVNVGTTVPHPQEPLRRLSHTLHVEQVSDIDKGVRDMSLFTFNI